MIDLGSVVVALIGGAAAGLVSWGAMRTEIKFLWRDLRRLEARHKVQEHRLSIVERRSSVRVVQNET